MTDKKRTKKFAEVILPLAAEGTFTYEIPYDFDYVGVGSRVLVNFGKQKMYAGIVRALHNNAPSYNTKPLSDVLEKDPVVPEVSLKFWEWMAEYYMCTLGEVCEAALPAMFKIHSETRIFAIEKTVPETLEQDDARTLLQIIIAHQEMRIKELLTHFSSQKLMRLIKTLTAEKYIGIREAVSEQYKPKVTRTLRLNYNLAAKGNVDLKELKRAPAQKKVLEYFWKAQGAAARKAVKEGAGVSDAVLKSLIDKGWLIEEEYVVDRLVEQVAEPEPLPQLSAKQHEVFETILSEWEKQKPTLLYGVTSSGKTEVYFHLISRIIQEGKQALVLLPEIALTGQLVHRFRKVFGEKVAVYHSRIHAAQRIEMWHDVRKGERFQVIIGPRSAIFLPYRNLGCIIVDEEHDRSYKQQDPAPRYNARDAAIVLSNLYKAKVLMGTATPSLESLANHKAKKYALVKLVERFGAFTHPEIVIVDYAKWWRRRKVRAHLTPILLSAVTEELEAGKQVILFQNRRGFSPYLQCFDCGHIPVCPHCDVRLTYHKRDNRLVCHYCGFSVRNAGKCVECGNVNMKTMGFGTEKIEEELQAILPDARIARFDQDATRRKNSHERIIGQFDQGEIDILVGTQMVTKGLDFRNVNLVGVLNADNLFSFPDFRSFERSMQLLMQVAGRAGRHADNGQVIIQTSQPEHSVISYLQEGNYGVFAEHELQQRYQFAYPPFTRILAVTLKHKKYEVCKRAANLLATACKKISGLQVLGPQAPVIGRIQTYYIMELTLKMERSAQTLEIKSAVNNAIAKVRQAEGLKSVIINPDMDPY